MTINDGRIVSIRIEMTLIAGLSLRMRGYGQKGIKDYFLAKIFSEFCLGTLAR